MGDPHYGLRGQLESVRCGDGAKCAAKQDDAADGSLHGSHADPPSEARLSHNPVMVRIAAEEAWAPDYLLARYRKVLEEKPEAWDPGFRSLWGFFLGKTERATSLARRIQDLGAERLRDMDATGIARQLLLLTSPGVQVFDAPEAVSLARETNDPPT